ncbi:hypothetical protein [Chamaesiphon sp. GL140_3_metabinner_50]|uniref:hypothetical protein n=1 Tax=Chamaesiphon sp. GL140_3_metabinner_50 TaxID=2970812 RepID=UPI0025CE4823|nr:hypothetical protein [Chamaesiphon sp. GL140_3_metabinner_50]
MLDFWVCKTAKSADARDFGNELKGGFGSINEAISCVQIVGADIGRNVNEVLNNDRAFAQLCHDYLP